MASADTIPAQTKEMVRGTENHQSSSADSLIPSPPDLAQQPLQLNAQIARLPVELDVAIPIRQFRIRNLIAIEPGQVIATQWAHADDLPLRAGAVQLAWTEFEVVDTRLAVRVTRLA